MKVKFGDIIVDSADEKGLCNFYAALLGWEKLELFGHPALRGEGMTLLFVQEEDYVSPVWPEEAGKQQKQMHFDFVADDVPAAVRQAELLGAVKTVAQFGGPYFTTMLDPAGHPFCLCAAE